MRYVIDVNILISSLIKDSLTRKIILESELELFFPEISYMKIIEHKDYILKKASLDDKEFFVLLKKAMSHICLVKKEDIEPYWDIAFNLMKNIDEEDSIFIATAFALGKNCIIWSDDKHLKKQKAVHIITTKDLVKNLLD